MTTSEQQLAEHPLGESLEQLTTSLKAAKQSAEGLDDAGAAVEVALRLLHVVEFAKRAVQMADPLLVIRADLDSMSTVATAVKSHVDNFSSDKNPTHLQQAATAADKIVRAANNLPQVVSAPDGEALRATLRGLQEDGKRRVQELGARVQETEGQAAKVNKTLKGLNETITSDKARLDQAITAHQQQFSEEQNTRQQAFTTAEGERTKKATAAQTEWTDKLRALETQSKSSFDQALREAKDEQDKFKGERDAQAHKVLADLGGQLEQAKKLVGLIAGTGMAGGYQRDANSEKRAFWICRALAVLSFLGLIWFAVALFLATTRETEFSWPHLLGRLVAVAAFGAFAAFAASMAKGHRESERRHRHKQLALESVNAFLGDLDQQTQKTIRKEIAEAFFTKSETVGAVATDGTQVPVKEILDLLRQAVAKLR